MWAHSLAAGSRGVDSQLGSPSRIPRRDGCAQRGQPWPHVPAVLPAAPIPPESRPLPASRVLRSRRLPVLGLGHLWCPNFLESELRARKGLRFQGSQSPGAPPTYVSALASPIRRVWLACEHSHPCIGHPPHALHTHACTHSRAHTHTRCCLRKPVI